MNRSLPDFAAALVVIPVALVLFAAKTSGSSRVLAEPSPVPAIEVP